GGGQLFSSVGIYRGVLVAIKKLKKEHVQITRDILMEFNQMRDIAHENLNVFAGACIEPPNIAVFWYYCPKGSLNQDVLENEAIKLDNTFKLSFMLDISKGMHYLHSSHLSSHGNLKSSNCLIDSRWTLKITDYGLASFLAGQSFYEAEMDMYKKKLWTAPEILRENIPPLKGTQKGDVFSCAIVYFEIITRAEPYNFDNITPRDVICRVRNGESIAYRPALPETSEMGRQILDLIRSMWNENPDLRPTFHFVKSAVSKISDGDSISILDTVMKMMEKYAQNLEESVEERTRQLLEEKKKTDELLYKLLPVSVAEQLKVGKFVQPENYEQSTIYFSDIVGFTSISADSSPMQIVDFLNDLYSCFDDVISTHDVYKVETIGDAYMVVSGVPSKNGNKHVAEIANVSLDLLSAVMSFKIRHRPHHQLQLRIGLNSGAVVAGVVGNIMPRYCLFGDTVNMAAKMESSGKPLRIHLSRTTYVALKAFKDYKITPRGEMNIKV
ncbi:hypothetical protein HELRODRAFT_83244, partial [Helobdella robusta]|uniref:Guanylate cyclase n=1 Tax=Helobdella robusta TaxID=6412 RepID=T1G525_HELRO